MRYYMQRISPVDLARKYELAGADELVFLDISATEERRATLVPMVEAVARELSIPFTVGGGVRSVADARKLLLAGADKIAVNSAAVDRPDLINELAEAFGRQCVVLAVDAKRVDGKWKVFVKGGKEPTNRELREWVNDSEERGAGEILFTSKNADGTKDGFQLEALKLLGESSSLPLIASGGAGNIEHFRDVFMVDGVDAALAASVFHFHEIEIPDLKRYLAEINIAIRQ
jgi:cyclase